MKRRIFQVSLLALCCFAAYMLGRATAGHGPLTDTEGAERIVGMTFDHAKNDSLQDGLRDQLANYQKIRAVPVPNSVIPAVQFLLRPGSSPPELTQRRIRYSPVGSIRRPKNLEDAAFWSVCQLGELIRTRQVTSVELTTMYLGRLKRYGPKLECVITLTEDLALRQAKRADEEIARGVYRGSLHGVPYGLKDLFATKGIRTTWGSVPYKDQMIDEDAAVVRKLEDAGAVLIAKTTLGELAMDDVWFGGQTRNPWNFTQGSSGSSAGSAAATAAGLVGFSIGTETWGSIVSPSTRCGVTGLRPTFGRVSRAGAMALSWSMDKVGPICRTVEDCAVVFNAIRGADPRDPMSVDAPFNYEPFKDLAHLRIGILTSAFDSVKENRSSYDSLLTVLRSLGATLVTIALPQKYPINDLAIILNAEAGAAFDDLTRSGKDGQLVRQNKDSWPNIFRLSRFIPAVEYVQANRIRTLLIADMQNVMKQVDLYVAPPFEGDNSLLTNLTGHPCVVLPIGFTKEGSPISVTFMGQLFGEAGLLAAARAYQEATGFHLRHPDLNRP